MIYMTHDTFLCNQIFPFANVIAFAIENNKKVMYPNFSKQAVNFPYFKNGDLCTFPSGDDVGFFWKSLAHNKSLEKQVLRINHKINFFPHILMNPQQNYDFEDRSNRSTNQEIISGRGAIFDGLYFLSRNNFLHSKNIIKNVFTPTDEILSNVDACISRAREGTDILIGTHMRFGDYLTFKKDMAYTVSEYYEVMKKFKNLFHNYKTTFLLCSDQKQDISSFPEVHAVTAPGEAVEDLYCLSKCDLIIGPPSTFSQWASFYGDVPVFKINYKNEIKYGFKVTEPNINEFFIHQSGFGSHSSSERSSMKKICAL